MNISEKLPSFIEIVRVANAKEAARRLGYKSHSSVLRNIEELEKKLKYALIENVAPNKIELTSKGKQFYNRVIDVYQEKEKIDTQIDDYIKFDSVHSNTDQIYIRVLTSAGVLSLVVIDRLKKFFKTHKNVHLALSTIQRANDVVKRNFDIAILPKNKYLENFSHKKLFTFNHKLYASQSYLEERGIPQTNDDLKKHDLISFYFSEEYDWGNVDWHISDHSSRHTIDLASAQFQACVSGYGIISFPEEYPEITKHLKNILPEMVRKKDVFFITSKNIDEKSLENEIFCYLQKHK